MMRCLIRRDRDCDIDTRSDSHISTDVPKNTRIPYNVRHIAMPNDCA